jgi:hypothetical protein
MKRVFPALLMSAAMWGQQKPAAVPVVLELFTSEGCSSCPPADRLLEQFDRAQPVPGADLIVMSEHVDYWNQLGWQDPFSSSFYSDRQRMYASRLHGDVYTPELVVDGARGFVGSDQREALSAIREAMKHPKQALDVQTARAAGKLNVSVDLPAEMKGPVYFALAHDAMQSKVSAGENSGRALTHVAVVFAIEKGNRTPTGASHEFSGKLSGNVRVIAFATDSSGRIVAAGKSLLEDNQRAGK